MTERTIDLDALAAELNSEGYLVDVEVVPYLLERRLTSGGVTVSPGGSAWFCFPVVINWPVLDIIRRHVDPMYAKQDQPSCAPTPTAPAPVCPTCEGKNDCQVEGKYPNGEGCGYFVECPDCEGTGLDLSYEACPNCDKDLAIDVHNECIAQFKSSTVPEAEPSPLVPTPVDLHARLIEIFNANTTSYGAGNATCFDFDGVAAADAVVQLLGYPAIERPKREVLPAKEGEMPW